MITLDDYWMGRDAAYAADLTPEIRDNAVELLGRVNLLISFAHKDGVWPGIDTVTGTPVAGGWRPPAVNARTQNAGQYSNHITARAVDIQDTPDRAFARWCLRNIELLAEIGLWMENPQWTPDWVHLQIVPPRSGLRVYRPSMSQPLAAKLPEQIERGVA